jgi:hypothetical protein
MKEAVNKDIVITLHEDEGYKTAIVAVVGRKYIGVIYPDSAGIRIRKITHDAKYVVTDYPAKKAKRLLRACGKKFGITKGAKKALAA